MSSLIPRARFILRAAPVALAVALSACAGSTSLHLAHDAEFRQDYDRAVVEYTKVLRAKPDDGDARAGLERAKVRASEEHLQRARRLSAIGKLDEALVEYGTAADLNPTSSVINEELRSTRNKLRVRVAVSREGKTELQTLIDRTRDLPPAGLDLPQNARMPGTLSFRDAGSRDVFMAIARFAGISLIFDSTFRESPVTVDLRNSSLPDALNTVAGATPAKRREYEEEIVRTFYLSNADLKETMDLLRLILDARRISPITATNAITIKDTPEHISAAARVLSAIDKARPEVVIDVELLEIDRTKLLEYGLQIASPGSPGLNGAVTIAPGGTPTETLTLQALKNLSQSDILLTNLPGIYYRLLKTDTNTRALANPQLRTSEGMTATARFGDRVPVPVTTFAPIATGGTPQQPITSFQYENVGVNIDITPRMHHDDDVTLQLNIAITSISGTGFGGLPTFGNREIKTVIRLRDGETSLLAGLIRDDERRTLDGIPGLSDLPLLGHLFSHSTRQTEQSDIVLTLTPHIVRVLDLNEADLRPFKVGRESVTLVDLPIPLPVPVPTAPEPAAPAQPAAPPPATPAPPTPGPILPPR